jgi:5-methylcytosine-specific restriction protein B
MFGDLQEIDERTEQRGQAFQRALEAGPLAEHSDVRYIDQYGTGTAFAVLPGGLYVGGPNFKSTPLRGGALLIRGAIQFLPDEELHLGVYIREGVANLAAWLEKMVGNANLGDSSFSKENNNVKFYFVLNKGKLFVRNKGFLRSLISVDDGPPTRVDGSEVGPAIEIDNLYYAVHPDRSGIRSAQVTEFLNTLDSSLGSEKLKGVAAWSDRDGLVEHVARMPHVVPIGEIRQGVADYGGRYAADLVDRFHIGLNFLKHKHFLILTGTSGTGKTLLVRAYSHVIHGIADATIDDPFLFMCPVRPDWTDPSGLTGYFDVIAGEYVVPPFLKAILTARSRPDTPIFVCLDEMNLARVEYYLADILSAMESGKRIQLHSHAVPVRGTSGTLIEPNIELPRNLYIIGTINIDETTHPISDKVLDRAILIDTSEVDVGGFLDDLKAGEPQLTAAIDACRSILVGVNAVLGPHRLGFGIRVADEFVRYAHAAHTYAGTPLENAIDHQLVQKVLVKLKGTDKQSKMLDDLRELVGKHEKSMSLVDAMLADLDAFGSFQVTR